VTVDTTQTADETHVQTQDAQTAQAAHDALALLRSATPAAIDVLTCILTRGRIARIEIAKLTGLSQAAVTKSVSPLIAAGLVSEESDLPRSGIPGRPVNPLRVNSDALVVLGIKVNANDIIGVATGLSADVRTTTHQTIPDTRFDTIVEGIVSVADRLRDELGQDVERLAGIGVTVSGDVDSSTGFVRESALLGWNGLALGEVLQARLGTTVVVENDVRALTIAEHWFGVGVGTESFAIVTIGAGIGSGLHVNGEVVEGAYGVAGEIGHLPLTSRDHVCSCGRRGCVEAVASSGAIAAAVSRGHGGRELSFAEAIDLAHTGDAVARAAFDEAGTVIGTAIATMVNLTGPELVLISGEAVSDYDLYDERIRAAFAEHAFGAAASCRIVTRPHTFDDWARGAAATVIRALVTKRQTA
jgi:predicted NBD/HSP70 family sugar kinase